MENKIYCWHASFNSSFNLETFGATFGKDNFINNVYNRLKDQSGINGYTLFIVDFFEEMLGCILLLTKNYTK